MSVHLPVFREHLRKVQATRGGERRKRKRNVRVLYTPVHKASAAAVPVPSNKSFFMKKSKLSLEKKKF